MITDAPCLWPWRSSGSDERVRSAVFLEHARAGGGVEVTAGPEKQWWPDAQGNADIIYGGAEYMLTQFNQEASRASG